MKTFATQGFTAALFMAASTLFGQAPATPDQPQFPGTTPSAGNKGKPAAQISPATGEYFESLAVPPAPGQPVGKRVTSTRYVTPREDVSPIVVQFSADNDALDLLQEDLAILGVQIRKALDGTSEQDVLTKPGTLLRASAAPSVRTLYLDGFGVLVFVKVGFPLFGPAAAPVNSPEPPKTEWDQTKEELLSEKRKNLTTEYVTGQPYDAVQVETLKTQIFTALKDATNIRTIKPADVVAITVFGPPATSGGKQSVSEWRGTVLSLRVKKSDIDAYAANKLDLDAFKAKATLATYSGSGYGVTSINSWAKGGASLQIR